MSKKNFHIYLEFNYTELNIAAFNKINNKLEYFDQKLYKSYFNNNELNFDILQNFVEKNILEVEKAIGEFVKDIYLMIETPQSTSINLSVLKNNEGNKITKQDVMYLIQDAKQQILKSNSAIEIIHIIYFPDPFQTVMDRCKIYNGILNGRTGKIKCMCHGCSCQDILQVMQSF